MGNFLISIDASGGHGCERDKTDGERVFGCGRMNCPDCLTAKFIGELQRAGVIIKRAAFHHWPGQSGEVRDDYDSAYHPTLMLAPRVRRGKF